MDTSPPAVFFSYARSDDDAENGRLSDLRKALELELRTVSGDPWRVFQDVEDIAIGEQWRKRLAEGVSGSTFFVPVLTPTYLKRRICRDELIRFLARERELNRDDLVIPLLYLHTGPLADENLRKSDHLAATLAARNWDDWTGLRDHALKTAKVRRRMNRLAKAILAAHERKVPLFESDPPNVDQLPSESKVSIASPSSAQTETAPKSPEPSVTKQQTPAGKEQRSMRIPADQAIYRQVTGEESPQHPKVVFPLHGIRTRAQWQRTFTEIAINAGWKCRLERWSFGYLSLLEFLWPFGKKKKLRWFRDTYYEEINTRGLDLDSDQLPSVVAHSFGSYIVGHAMLKYEFLRFNKVILCGSILPVDFPWDALLERGQVRAVRNEFGVKDVWVKLSKFFVAGTGFSGATGFTRFHPRLEQQLFLYEHSEYFSNGHIEAFWIPFLERQDAIAAVSGLPVAEPKSAIPIGAAIVFFVCVITLLASLYSPINKAGSRTAAALEPKPTGSPSPASSPSSTALPTASPVSTLEITATPPLPPSPSASPWIVQSSIGMELRWVEPLKVWVGRYEVTQAEFRAITGRNPSLYEGDRRPVDKVRWTDAEEFCQKLTAKDRAAGVIVSPMTYRLPREDEFDVFVGNAGLGDAVTSNYEKRRSTMEVGSLGANQYGLYDVRGNVWEWMANKYLRGACWDTNDQEGAQVEYRFLPNPNYNCQNFGFRCVLTRKP